MNVEVFLKLTLNIEKSKQKYFQACFSQNLLKNPANPQNLKIPFSMSPQLSSLNSPNICSKLIISAFICWKSPIPICKRFLASSRFQFFHVENIMSIYYGFLNANLDILELNALSLLPNSFSRIRMHTRCIKSQSWCNAENVFFT